MSGDVQPRKRKNKGKKKEDAGGEEDIFSSLKNSSDEVIHVHKDIGCGGNVLTKLIFFFILATIGVMVGVILLEYRGSSDEDTTSAVDSPWSVTFQHWVDDDADKHHTHDGEQSEELEDYDVHSERHVHDAQNVPEKEHIDHSGESGNEGDNTIFSWFFFWRGFSKDVEEPSFEENEGLFNSFLELISFGSSGNEGDEEVVTDNSEVEESSGQFLGWFGFGGGKELTENEEESHSNEIEEPQNEEEEDEVEDEEQEDVENKASEMDDIEQEEEGDEIYGRENDSREEEDDEIEGKDDSRGEEDDEIDGKEDDSREEEDDEIEEKDDDSREQEDDEIEGKGMLEKDGLSNEEEDEEGDNAWNNLSKPEDEDLDDQGPSSEDEIEELDEIQKNDIDSEDEGLGSLYEDEREEENEEGVDNSEERHRIISSENGSKSNFVDTDSLEEIPDEELFPEAREALRKEREELAKQEEQEKEEQEKEESKDEGFVEKESNNDENEEETEGMALKFGVGVALVVVAHVVLVKKWNSWAGEDPESFISESSVVTGGMEEEVKKEVKTQVPVGKMETLLPAATTVPSIPDLPAPTQEHTDDSPAADDETGDEVEAEDEEESELEIDKEKFKELIAKYGQDTPESSDIEPSDEEIHKSSGGEESAGDEAEEESPAEIVSGDERTSEDELKEWAGIKKSDIEKMTKLDSESEGDVEPEDEEEEESEDESSPPPPPPYHSAQRQRGGPNDIENLYPNDLITNDDDWAIREELDKADEEFNYEKAHSIFTALLEKHPDSPRARYGIAHSLDSLAEAKRSNKLLEISINSYFHALAAPNIPDNLFIKIATRLINRLRFRGLHLKAIDVHNRLIKKFLNTPEYRNELAITYLIVNDLENAKSVLKEVLKLWPEDPFALAHYGLVLKLEGNVHGCIKFLEAGIKSELSSLRDPRLFFHLGDALTRVGRALDAEKASS